MANSDERDTRAVMRLSPQDNIAVALRPLKAGETVTLDGVSLTINRNIPVGQKLAAQAIAKGGIILKYGCAIGVAITPIVPGEYLHTHNVETNFYAPSALPK